MSISKLNKYDTPKFQEESILEGEINNEELPSFHISKNINQMMTFNDIKTGKWLLIFITIEQLLFPKMEKVNKTPANDLLKRLKHCKETDKKSEILARLISRLNKGVSHHDRKKLWGSIWNTGKKIGNGTYSELLKLPCEWISIIEKDVERTTINDMDIKPGTKCYKDTVELLHAISVGRDELKYVQGMNFIAAALLQLFKNEEAFWVFEWLINDYKLLKMYTGKRSQKSCFRQHAIIAIIFISITDAIIKIHLPLVNKWLIDNSLDVDIFWPQWFLTLYSRNDNADLFYRTIDLLFITGTKALFQVALSLLDLLYKNGWFESWNFDKNIPASSIITNAKNFRVSNKLLKALEKKSQFILRKKNKKSLDSQNFKMFSLKTENFLKQNDGDESWYFEDIEM
jgi:hypothetical protein